MDPWQEGQQPQDSIDRIMADWGRVRPDLDTSAASAIARLARVQQVLTGELEAAYAEYGLNASDFAALVTLYRCDTPGGMSQTTLMRELMVTSGTVSVRVDRLYARGLVTRAQDPQDRRNSRVALTAAGRALFERVTPGYLAAEKRLLTALSSEKIETLVATLRELLVSFEGSAPEGALPRLGLVLVSAHRTAQTRRAVGLPETVGLLVRTVEPGGRADQAGIAVGDVLVDAGGHELRSITALYKALDQAVPAGKMSVSAIRGLDAGIDAVLDLRPDRLGDRTPPETSGGGEAGIHIV